MVKNMLFAAMFAAVLSASAVSDHQLKTRANTLPACGSPCTKSIGCQKPCFCFLLVGSDTNGLCQPEGPPPPPDSVRK
jgi:hypothetical protein